LSIEHALPLDRRWPARALLVVACLALALAGCRHDMQNQNKMVTYRESTFFANGSSARMLPAHTVARGDLEADEAYYTGVRDRQPVAELPFPVTHELLRRGEQRYDIYCAPCHGKTGSGQGMIVTRGYKPPPPLYSDTLRNAQVGYFFNVMSQGYGIMPSYAAQVSVADRWAIAAYIRALQLSQNARLADLPPAAQKAIAGDLAQPAATPPGAAKPASEVP
jgi:mono/diheme cytochrome c family protein